MAKRNVSLYDQFEPLNYQLFITGNKCRLLISGKKLPPPSKRITLHQKGLKITDAKIIRNDKKGSSEHDVLRINHLPTFEQVRLHTAGMLYPGPYIIELNYQLRSEKLQALKALGDELPSRDLMPSIDESKAWDIASFEIK